MTDQTPIELILIDTYTRDGSSTISVQLSCGPSVEPDFEPLDLGLHEPIIQALFQKSQNDSATREVGEELLAALQQRDTFRRALENARAEQHCPISIILAGRNGTRLPWETLFDSTWPGFLELTGTTPINRAVKSHQSASSPSLLNEPRILAVLSAPRPGEPQSSTTDDWSYTELQNVRRAISMSGVAVDLRVVSSESSVLEEAASGGLTAIQLIDEYTITREIAKFDPHFLHFFCHGFDLPSPHLALYKPADIFTGIPQIRIDSDLLARHIGNTCLIVLNSCSGASSCNGSESMAQLLVSKRFPAAIAMREAIEWHDATNFTHALYRHVLDNLGSSAADRIDLRVMAALDMPRRVLLDRFGGQAAAAESHREWTLPIIYTRQRNVEIPVRAATPGDPSEQARREGGDLVVNSLRTQLHLDTPPKAAESLTKLADRNVSAAPLADANIETMRYAKVTQEEQVKLKAT